MLAGSATGTRYRLRGAPIIHDTIDGETIAINQLTGAYYSIEGPGALVWQMLGDGASASELAVQLSEAYETDAPDVEAALMAFLDEMATEELIVVDEQGGPSNGVESHQSSSALPAHPSTEGHRLAFTGLRLQRYNDLEVMLLADPIHEVDDTGWPMPLTDKRA